MAAFAARDAGNFYTLLLGLMAIQFNCPYCTAAIRVPDAYSGKQGSCPKCRTKLIVPTVVPPSAPPAAEAQPAPAAAPVPPAPPSSPAASSSPAGSANEIPPLAPDVAPPTVAISRRRKRRRKRASKLYSIVIPVVCFLTFFGIVIAVMLMRPQDLKGVLTGSVAQNMQIPSVTVPLASLQLTDDDQTEAMQAFEDSPEAFVSSQMTCRIRLDGKSLVVDVAAGKEFQWFAVNPNSSINLRDWIRDHVSTANTQRLNRIAETGTALCKDKILKASGSRVVFDAATYRDGFGLNAHVDAFGFVVEAATGNRVSPCAHEDSKGTLYFALPRGTTSFVLRGRSQDGGKPMFPGEYTVQVSTAANAAPEESPADDSSTEPVEDSGAEPTTTMENGDDAHDADASENVRNPGAD